MAVSCTSSPLGRHSTRESPARCCHVSRGVFWFRPSRLCGLGQILVSAKAWRMSLHLGLLHATVLYIHACMHTCMHTYHVYMHAYIHVQHAASQGEERSSNHTVSVELQLARRQLGRLDIHVGQEVVDPVLRDGQAKRMRG